MILMNNYFFEGMLLYGIDNKIVLWCMVGLFIGLLLVFINVCYCCVWFVCLLE